jgi:hypothetical protein
VWSRSGVRSSHVSVPDRAHNGTDVHDSRRHGGGTSPTATVGRPATRAGASASPHGMRTVTMGAHDARHQQTHTTADGGCRDVGSGAAACRCGAPPPGGRLPRVPPVPRAPTARGWWRVTRAQGPSVARLAAGGQPGRCLGRCVVVTGPGHERRLEVVALFLIWVPVLSERTPQGKAEERARRLGGWRELRGVRRPQRLGCRA